MKRILILCLIITFTRFPLQGALVNLTLFNSVALEEADDLTTLLDGDLVQLILDGGNLTQDPADETGALTGDDTLLSHANNPTVLGAGQVGTDTGFVLVQMSYDDTLAGTNAYVRFFNDPTPTEGDFYGQSAWFQLPDADEFGNAEIDFMPIINDHMANIAVIPEPAGMYLMSLVLTGAAGFMLIIRKRN